MRVHKNMNSCKEEPGHNINIWLQNAEQQINTHIWGNEERRSTYSEKIRS